MKKTFIFLAILVFGVLSSAQARIINIPADYVAIQAGIEASINGDTVLVQPGTYHENINFDGHNILLASLYLMNSDTSNITTTIIESDSSDWVIKFNHGEDTNTALIGFTIRHDSSNYGGGIYCDNSSPRISRNIITQNRNHGLGGGICCDSSSARISFNIISINAGFDDGGGIFSLHSHNLIINNVIYGNTAYS